MTGDVEPTAVMRVLRAGAYRESLTMRPPQPATSATPVETADPRAVWQLGLLCPHCGAPCLPDPTREPLNSPTHREQYVRCGGCGAVLHVAIQLTTIHNGDGIRHIPDHHHRDLTAPGAPLIDAVMAATAEESRRAS